ncbi:MAG: glycogen debranching protein, partial [Actinomycetota bacterium]|nr:glycogen debranching protein [Actinomycetota bacterium]
MLRSLVVAALMALGFLMPPPAAAADTLSTSQRLQDRRYVAAGDRAQVEGFQDGRFYANGWHITGEMGGVWTPPLKLVDGVWFGIDGQWAGPASRFTSGWGYTRMSLPPASGLSLKRTDFAPEGRRAGLFGLELTNASGGSKT